MSKPKTEPVHRLEVDHEQTREGETNEVVEDVAPGVNRVNPADGKWARVVDPKGVAPPEK